MSVVMVDTLTMTGVLTRVPLIERPIPAPRYASRVRVRRAGQWVDITDWVAIGTTTETNDPAVSVLDVRLHNGTEYDSLAPRVRTSPMNRVGNQYVPLLDRYNEILVEAAMTTDGSEPTEFVPMFGGYLGDRTDTDKNADGLTLPLEIRDYAKQLMDDYIDEPIEFEGGEWASVIIQQLLDRRYQDGHLPDPIVLHVIGIDDFWISKPWVAERESTWQAIQKFAQQSNKDIRYMLNEATGDMRLTYWTPSTAMVPGWSVNEDDIRQETLETSDAGIRYRVVVHWRDTDGELQETAREDFTNRRPKEPIRVMHIGEEYTELIGDEEGAERFADAILSGATTIPATTRLRLPFNPFMRVHDVLLVEHADIRSEPELHAVEEIRRTFSADDWSMEVVASESVKLRPDYWLSIEDRPGVAGESLPPEKIGGGAIVMPRPENVVVSPMELGLSVHVPVPPVHASRWSITEVHVSTQQDFTPTAATRMAANRSTYIPVPGLPPVPHYVRAVYVDISGDRSAPSDEHGPVTPFKIDRKWFIDGIEPVLLVPSLPDPPGPEYPQGTVVFHMGDNKLYRSTGAAWTAVVDGDDIPDEAIKARHMAVDSVTAGAIAAGAVNADAVGSNKVITKSANIGDAVIESAHIKDLSANKIDGGTLWLKDGMGIQSEDGRSTITPTLWEHRGPDDKLLFQMQGGNAYYAGDLAADSVLSNSPLLSALTDFDSVTESNKITKTSVAWENMPQMNLNVTVAHPTLLFVIANPGAAGEYGIVFSDTFSASAWCRLLVNGSVVQTGAPTTGVVAPLFQILAVNAGTHNIRIQWAIDNKWGASGIEATARGIYVMKFRR